MKKKFFVLAAVLVVLVSSLALAACGTSAEVYYEYRNGNYIESSYFELDGDKYSVVNGAESSSGTVKIDGTSLTLYMKVGGNSIECGRGTISDGVVALFDTKGEPYIYYCLKGKTPHVDPEKPSDGKLTVGDITAAIDRLVNGEPYKANVGGAYSSADKPGAELSGNIEVLGGGIIRFVPSGREGADGAAKPEVIEYIVDTNNGYVYTRTEAGLEFKQYVPQGAVMYALELYKAQIAAADGQKEIAADGLVYDGKTRTLTFDRDFAEEANDLLEPLYKAYSSSRNVEWLINAYLEKAAPGSGIELEDIIDDVIENAVKNENATVGDTIVGIELVTKMSIFDILKRYVTEAQYKEITERKLGEMLMGAIGYLESSIAPDLSLDTIMGMLNGGEVDITTLLNTVFPNGFDRNAFYDAAFKTEVSTEGLEAKLSEYKKLLMVGIRALYVDDIIDATLGRENAPSAQSALYFAIKNGIAFTKLDVKSKLVFDEDMNVSSLEFDAEIVHGYTADPDVKSVFDDNNFKLSFAIGVTDYDFGGEKWSPDGKFAPESAPDAYYVAVVDRNKLGDGDIVLYYEWGNVQSPDVTVKSVSYSDENGISHALDNSIVKYNDNGTFAFTASGVKQAIAKEDYSYTTGITAQFEVAAGESTYTLTLTLITMTDDADGMLGGLPAIIEKIIEIAGSGNAPVSPDAGGGGTV